MKPRHQQRQPRQLTRESFDLPAETLWPLLAGPFAIAGAAVALLAGLGLATAAGLAMLGVIAAGVTALTVSVAAELLGDFVLEHAQSLDSSKSPTDIKRDDQ